MNLKLIGGDSLNEIELNGVMFQFDTYRSNKVKFVKLE